MLIEFCIQYKADFLKKKRKFSKIRKIIKYLWESITLLFDYLLYLLKPVQ